MNALPFLSSLGVNIVHQLRMPELVSFPNAFNPFGSSVWAVAVQKVPDTLPVEAAWKYAIETYVQLCQELDVYPFRRSGSNNEKLLAHLSANRQALIHDLELVQHPFLDQYSVLTIDRICELSEEGFVLTVGSIFIVEDPTFKQHLTNQGFTLIDSQYFKRVNQNSHITFRLTEIATRWKVTYVITGRMLPELPEKLATKEQLEKFFVKRLWFPLTRSARVDHQGPRFI